MGVKDIFKGKGKDKGNGDHADDGTGSNPTAMTQFMTRADFEAMSAQLVRQVADISIRATDERQQQWLAKGGGVPPGAPRNEEEARNLKTLIYMPGNQRLRQMTLFNQKEVSLHPWLCTLDESLKPGRRHGSLLGTFLRNKEACNRSLDGFLLTQTVTMAGMETQREGFTDMHSSS